MSPFGLMCIFRTFVQNVFLKVRGRRGGEKKSPVILKRHRADE